MEDDEESTLSSLLDEVEEVRVRGGLEMDDSDDVDMDLDDFTPPLQQQKETPKEVNKNAFQNGTGRNRRAVCLLVTRL